MRSQTAATVALALVLGSLSASCGKGGAPNPLASATLPQDGSLAAELDAIRARHALPALAAFSLGGGQFVEQAAVGLRAAGRREAVTLADRWHIGSLTKSMTATLCAVLVEQGRLSWTTTVADVFPDLVPEMRVEYRPVRLEELLSHTGGVVTDIARAPSWSRLPASTEPLAAQRRRLVSELLALAGDATRGRYAYSNGGYVIAGSMLEELTGETWENLITTRVLTPLGMTSTGFGAPGTPGAAAPDEPWGHAARSGVLFFVMPGPAADNPSAVGPAGSVHSTLADLARYFTLHLDGARGLPTRLLTSQSFAKLHRAVPGAEYALGWGVTERAWAHGGVLQHGGSNGLWQATVWLAPNRDLGLFAVTNAAGDAAFEATDAAVVALIQRRGIAVH